MGGTGGERIIRLSPEERGRGRERCMRLIVIKSANTENIGKPNCAILNEPTPEELEKLKK